MRSAPARTQKTQMMRSIPLPLSLLLGCASAPPPGAAPPSAPPSEHAADEANTQPATSWADAGDEQMYVQACLQAEVATEANSQLWNDLSKFAFALSDEDASPATPEQTQRVLDQAERQVPALNSEAAWQSAGRYFQTENFHSFEVPACQRAWDLRENSGSRQ
jgi:hypothetical protein